MKNKPKICQLVSIRRYLSMSFSQFDTQELEKVTLHQLNFHARFRKKEIRTMLAFKEIVWMQQAAVFKSSQEFIFLSCTPFFKRLLLVSRLVTCNNIYFYRKETYGKKNAFYQTQESVYCFAEVLCSRMIPVNNIKKYPFRHFKGIRMSNFYFINALGQNLANSESCLILRFL